MNIVPILLLVCVSTAVQAEVFKCTGGSGKTVYQEKPCQAAVKSQQLDIKADPEQEAAAKAKLEALETEYAARKAAQIEAEKESAAIKNQTEQVEALKRSALAQQQQAAAQQRQAEALERQNQQFNNPLLLLSPGTIRRHAEDRRDDRFDGWDRQHNKSRVEKMRKPVAE